MIGSKKYNTDTDSYVYDVWISVNVDIPMLAEFYNLFKTNDLNRYEINERLDYFMEEYFMSSMTKTSWDGLTCNWQIITTLNNGDTINSYDNSYHRCLSNHLIAIF